MRTISFKMPDDLLVQPDVEVKARRVTKSCVMRESLESTLRKQPLRGESSCYNLARDLAGAVKGLPEDLASDAKYLEGLRLSHLPATW